MSRSLAFLLMAVSTTACSALPAGRSEQPAAPPRTSTAVYNPADNQCLSRLGSSGAQFTPLPDRYLDTGCTNLGTVQLSSMAGDRNNLVATNLGPVTCEVSNAFAGWARFGVDRAAVQILGSPVRSIETMGSYSCRNVAGSNRRSAHATGAAIDVGAFVLADGRRISVKSGWNGNAKEREFLRVVRESACKRFGTVLSPDYNAAHHDHLHVEGVAGGKPYCR